MKVQSIKIQFRGGAGHMLDARLETPMEPPRAFAIFSHCFTCTKDTLAVFRVSRQLASKGIAVLRFDFTGLGASEGEFATTNFTSNIADINAAIKYLSERYQAPSLLIGHSLGGTAMLAAASKANSVKAVATIASPSQPDHVLHHFGQKLELLEQGMPVSITVADQQYRIDPQFIHDVRKHNMKYHLMFMNKPVLIFNVVHDALVSGNNADEIKEMVNGDAVIVNLEDADHVLSDKHDAEFVADMISNWYSGVKEQVSFF
jgi:putative redox protein